MSLNEIGSWVATLAGVVATIYAMLAYHHPKRPVRAVAGRSGRSPLAYIAILLGLTSLCASAVVTFRQQGARGSLAASLQSQVTRADVADGRAVQLQKQLQAAAGRQTLLEMRLKKRPAVAEPTATECKTARATEELEKRLRDGTF